MPSMLVIRLPQTMVEMMDCVSANDYAHVLNLSKIDKYRLLEESDFQLLLVVLLMHQFVGAHEEILVPDASSQEVEASKARNTPTKVKVSNFERDCSGLRSRLDQVSPCLKEVTLHKSPTTLVGRIAELECMLEEEKQGSR